MDQVRIEFFLEIGYTIPHFVEFMQIASHQCTMKVKAVNGDTLEKHLIRQIEIAVRCNHPEFKALFLHGMNKRQAEYFDTTDRRLKGL